MDLSRQLASRRMLLIVALALLVPCTSWAQGKPRTKGFDTDGNGSIDVTIRAIDTDGDGTADKVHIDCDNDGVEDPGETVIPGRGPKGVSWHGGGGGFKGMRITITADTGTETTKTVLQILDKNNNGTTCDNGDIVSGG